MVQLQADSPTATEAQQAIHDGVSASLIGLIRNGFSIGVISKPDSPAMVLTSNDPIIAAGMAHALSTRGFTLGPVRWEDTATTVKVSPVRDEASLAAFRAAAEEVNATWGGYVRARNAGVSK